VTPLNQTLRFPAVPVVERVPLMVWRESKVTWVTPAADGAVMARLLKVFTPWIAKDVTDVAVQDTL
jgi:hypothetical protein